MLKERIIDLEKEAEDKTQAVQSSVIPETSMSEVNSVSTVSKIEESHRLKDIEDSFEERYFKLKALALKLKKKLQDQTSLTKTMEEQVQELKNEKQELIRKFESGFANAKIVQCMQAEIDQIQDDFEKASKDLKLTKKELERKDETLKEITDNNDKIIKELSDKNLTMKTELDESKKRCEALAKDVENSKNVSIVLTYCSTCY